MALPPEDFVAIAERLRDGHGIQGEGRHRTVVGRAYYGAYLVTCRRISQKQGINPPDTFDHEGLCHTLAGFMGNDNVRKFGTILDSLRQRRVHADYHPSRDMYDDVADDAIDDANALLEMLPAVINFFPTITERHSR